MRVAILCRGTACIRAEANGATNKSGYGHIKQEGGSWHGIAPHGGGIVMTILDHVVPTRADDDDLEVMD